MRLEQTKNILYPGFLHCELWLLKNEPKTPNYLEEQSKWQHVHIEVHKTNEIIAQKPILVEQKQHHILLPWKNGKKLVRCVKQPNPSNTFAAEPNTITTFWYRDK